jgi:hypothetical protein
MEGPKVRWNSDGLAVLMEFRVETKWYDWQVWGKPVVGWFALTVS